MINTTVLRLTVRGLFGRRRFLWLLPLPALLLGLAVLAALFGGADADLWVEPVLVALGLGIVLPVMALIIGASVLGSEIDDGTVIHLLTKPLPRREIVLSKLAVAVVVTSLVVGLAMFVSGILIDGPALGAGMAVGTAAAALAYSALFLALSVVSRRPVLLGLLYVLLWEGLLAGLLDGVRQLSIHHYALTVAESVSGSPLVTGQVSLPVALTMTAVVTAGATAFAVLRLRSFRLVGDAG